MKTLLLTFGCSWTYGVGVGYESGMSIDEYSLIGWDPNICNKLSWRGLISDKYDVFNRNFAVGGSSNQTQERLAMQYVTSYTFQQDQKTFDKIILLWGITSTARSEMFNLQKNKLDSFFLSNGTELSKSLLKLSYNHDFEVWFLSQKMRFWNLLFASLKIKNLWFDTFNHHDYTITQPGLDNVEYLYKKVKEPNWPSWQSFCEESDKIDNEILKEIMDTNRWPFWRYRRQSMDNLNLLFADQNPRDLMSLLCVKNGFDTVDQKYHTSSWQLGTKEDTNRVDYLVKKGILNPISFHPTKQGHVQISDILTNSVESLLG